MPGILPMKVIKVGTSAQSRIAQACDRCRSKKIRCDGVTPCCSQCANVGFECKTSDKLSRRAFPRGYTESLEERVRSLEDEARELKDLLDEKDEKIDMLSRMHSNSPSMRRPSSTTSTSSDALDTKQAVVTEQPKGDTFRIQQSPNLLDGEISDSDSYFMGASSGRSFVDVFKSKVQETGKACGDFKTDVFFTADLKDSKEIEETTMSLSPSTSPTPKAPPRIVSDQMINVFFQEWAPLFPVLHRPAILKVYSDYVADPESVEDLHSIIQLYLIFSIAATSADCNKQNMEDLESQWQPALEAVVEENSLPTLQCLILAQIYCIAKADYNKLLHYKGLAISVSHRLGLHQSQKRFSLGVLTLETRKKVFWTLYTLDCFSAALLGLPKLLNESDVHAEYPADVDDENVSEQGFQSTLPGESTRVSSALALFRGARIMSQVLEEIYPAALSHDVSLQKISALNDELDTWLASLPSHLRLEFVQDKPSTNVVGSRSPLLSLAYHYIRTLIHRPAVGSTLGNKASSSVVALAQSSKHIVQIIQLLEERRMSFSFCLNKNEVLLLAGFGLLFQTLTLDHKGKLIQDSQRLLCSVVSILERDAAPGATEFKKIACAMISIDRFSQSSRGSDDAASRRNSDTSMPAPKAVSKSSRKNEATMSRSKTSETKPVKQENNINIGRRFTAPTLPTGTLPIYDRRADRNSVSSAIPNRMQMKLHSKRTDLAGTSYQEPITLPNLDYLDFGSDAKPLPKSTTNLSPRQRNQFDNLVQSPDNSMFSYLSPSTMATDNLSTDDFCSDLWSMPLEFNCQPGAQSILSFSEEELTSGEEFSSCDLGNYGSIGTGKSDTLLELEGLDGGIGCESAVGLGL